MAQNINSVVLVGNLTRGSRAAAHAVRDRRDDARIAVNDRVKRGEDWQDAAYYFDVTVWDGGELRPVPRQGPPVGVQGKLTWREWDAQDGTKRQAVEVVADNVQFAAAATAARAARAGRRRAELVRRSQRPRPTTTFRSRRHAWHSRKPSRHASAPARRSPRTAQELPLLQGQGRRGRLQEPEPAPALHLGEGEDPQPPHHRRVAAGSGRSRSPSSRRARWRSCPTWSRADGGHPPLGRGQVGLRGDVVNVACGGRATSCSRASDEPGHSGPRRRAQAARRAARAPRGPLGRAGDRDRRRAPQDGAQLRRQGPTGALFGSVTTTDIADELWRTRKIRVDRKKIGRSRSAGSAATRFRSRSSRTSRST